MALTQVVHDQAADVWSCGVYLFIMLAAAFPFARASDEQLTPANKLHAVLQASC